MAVLEEILSKVINIVFEMRSQQSTSECFFICDIVFDKTVFMYDVIFDFIFGKKYLIERGFC